MTSKRILTLLVTVRSVINYALPLYGNTLKQSELNRLKQLQHRGAEVVTGALNFTSRQTLNDDLVLELIKQDTNLCRRLRRRIYYSYLSNLTQA